MPGYDLITLGRVSMDLFSEDVGAPFAEITAFAAHVGGSPTNIAVASSRLGLAVALLTAVGEDPVGRYVLHTLAREGVDTRFIPSKAGAHTGIAILGIEPPDKFPLVFYRQNPADIYLSADDLRLVPFDQSRALLLSGTALSRGPCHDAALYAVEQAQASGLIVFMDLDLRPDQWSHPNAFGLNVRAVLPQLNVVIGTEEEFFAALSPNRGPSTSDQRLSGEQREEIEARILSWFRRSGGPEAMVVKRGQGGATVYQRGGGIDQVPGFPVDVLNTVGAGDAFAAGLIYGRLQGQDWYQSARLGNACGALVVTRHGCAAAMPTEREVIAFMEAKGGR